MSKMVKSWGPSGFLPGSDCKTTGGENTTVKHQMQKKIVNAQDTISHGYFCSDILCMSAGLCTCGKIYTLI